MKYKIMMYILYYCINLGLEDFSPMTPGIGVNLAYKLLGGGLKFKHKKTTRKAF